MILGWLKLWKITTHGCGSSTSVSYQTYYDLLINACVRYDKTEKANIGKGRNVYNTNIDSTYVDCPTDVIGYVPDSFHGREVLIFLLMSSSRSMPFPLGICPLQGLATPPDHLSGPILKYLGPRSPSKGMMALSTCHLKSINF